MMELNLDIVFLLKGILSFILGVIFLFRSSVIRHSGSFWLAAYLILYAIHSWVHMCTLGVLPSGGIHFLLNATQAAAWGILAMASAVVLRARRPAWPVRYVPLLVLLFSLPSFFPPLSGLHAVSRLAAGGLAAVFAAIAFWFFPPYDRHLGLQRLMAIFLLLPVFASTLSPFFPNDVFWGMSSFWMETAEMLSLVAVFLTLHAFLARESAAIRMTAFGRRTTFHMKLITSALLASFATGSLWAHSAAVDADRRERTVLLNYLHSAQLAFSPREVALLSGTREDMMRLPYHDIKSRLQELVRILPNIRFAYLMAQRKDDVIFLVDSAPDDSEDASLPGEVYADASRTLRAVLSRGEAASEGPLPDRYGVWVSAFVPIRDQNRVLALLGMDVNARDWQRMLFRARLSPVLVTWLFSLLLIGIFIYVRRISENQEELALSEHRYRILFEESQDAYLLLQDVFVDCNAAAERLFGCSREEIIGRAPWDFSPERQPDGSLSQKLGQEYVSRAMEGKPQAFSWIHRNRAGSTLHTDVRLNRLTMDPPMLQVIIRDRTEEVHRAEQQRKMENRMAEMQKWEGLANLAGGVAHDFNNLITNIVGNVHLAQMEPGDAARMEQCHGAILESARIATDLARQMLAYAGKGSLSVRPFSLSDVLRQMEKVLVSVAGGRARIEMDLEDGLPALLGDATQIQQVILNLVINALEAMERPDGRIRISLSHRYFSSEEMQDCFYRELPGSGQYLVLRVSDNGKGISADVLPRIFEPFFTTKFTGRGLGLAAVAGIIHNHGGAVRVQSTLGQGTEFEVRLPATNKKPEPKSFVVEETQETLQALRILVVEDEDGLRQLAVRVLERQGHTVIAAADGEEGLMRARENRGKLDLVFADVLMPRMDGIEMARRIRAEFPNVPILVTSGHVPGDGTDYLSFTDGFLPKPYHYKELIKKIYETISEKNEYNNK